MLTADHVQWAYRLFLDREPESKQVVKEMLKQHATTRDLRYAFTRSPEFRFRHPFLEFSHKEIIYDTSFGFRQVLNLADSAVAGMILNEAYEPRETSFICKACKTGDVVLDIGANIGYYTLLMAKLVGPTGFVYAFEPREDFCDYIRRSVSENEFDPYCSIHCCALADFEGTVQFRIHPKRGLDPSDPNYYSTCYLAGSESDKDPEAFIDVKVEILDKILAANPERRVAFIKIDVEGAEYLVFRGAEELLRRDRPVILSEIFGPQLENVSKVNTLTYVKFLESFGYKCHTIGDGGAIAPIPDVKAFFTAKEFLKSPVVNVVFKAA
ncbi:MAG TPA: FkbM family methyltransferase [Gemmataceae bacterium]|nr:FkbM family methyltransferase [Gemmataceae bacterium]